MVKNCNARIKINTDYYIKYKVLVQSHDMLNLIFVLNHIKTKLTSS